MEMKRVVVGGRKIGFVEGDRMVYKNSDDLRDLLNAHEADPVTVGNDVITCYGLRSKIKAYTEESVDEEAEVPDTNV